MGATSYQNNHDPKQNKTKRTRVQQSSFSPFQQPCVPEFLNHKGRRRLVYFFTPILENVSIDGEKGKAVVLCLFGPAVGYY